MNGALGMKKEYVSYGIIGVVAGLVLGFIVANWVSSGASEGQPISAAATGSNPTSVNSSNSGQALPAGHPPLDSGQTIPAPPLPAGTPGAADASSPSPTDSSRRARGATFARSVARKAAKKSARSRSTRTFNCSRDFRPSG